MVFEILVAVDKLCAKETLALRVKFVIHLNAVPPEIVCKLMVTLVNIILFES